MLDHPTQQFIYIILYMLYIYFLISSQLVEQGGLVESMCYIYLLFFLGFFDGTFSLLLFSYHVTGTPHLTSLKGNEALEIFFFLLQGKEIWRGNQNLKKKLKFLYFRPHKRLLEVQKVSSMVENGVFF